MTEAVTKNLASGQCPDELTLQLYADNELQAPAAELLFHHLAHCRTCATTQAQMRELRRFCLEQLGDEELREIEFTRRVLQETRNNLPQIAPAKPRRRFSFNLNAWQRFALATAAILIVSIGVFWFWSEQKPGLTAKAVLDEAELRERLWEIQPGRVLHWVIETDITNSDQLPDGHYRSLHWRSNIAGQAGSVLRKYNQQNQLIFARWIKSDGAEIVFRHTPDGDVCTIYPTLDHTRAELRKLPEEQRTALEREFAVGRDLNDVAGLAEETAKYTRRQWEKGQVRMAKTDAGEVFRLRVERFITLKDKPPEHLEMERDMSATTFRQVRLSSRRRLADGSVRIEEARWTTFRDATLEEMAANDLTALLAQTKKIEQINAKAYVQKLLAVRSTSQPAPTSKPTEP